MDVQRDTLFDVQGRGEGVFEDLKNNKGRNQKRKNEKEGKNATLLIQSRTISSLAYFFKLFF